MINFKENIEVIVLIICLFLAGFIMLDVKKPIEVTTAECPTLTEVIKVEEINEVGWECEERGSYTDLLQPSGLWINQTFSCWRLEVPIEKFRKQECERTGDDYWCKNN